MNKRHPRWTAGLLLSLLGAGLWAVFAFGAGQSNDTYTIDRDVISAGGQLSESPAHQLVGTIGQASAIGQSENTLHINYGGFWKEDGTSSPTYYTLKIKKTGGGNGTVKTMNGTGIDCGSDCTEQYQEGSSISLIATPDADSTFGGWFVNDNPVTAPITVNQDITVTAKFILKSTPTPTPVPTNTPTPVPTATPVPTSTPPVSTNTPTPVPTSIPTPTPTSTPTPGPTSTPTPTPTPTSTPTPEPFPTVIPNPDSDEQFVVSPGEKNLLTEVELGVNVYNGDKDLNSAKFCIKGIAGDDRVLCWTASPDDDVNESQYHQYDLLKNSRYEVWAYLAHHTPQGQIGGAMYTLPHSSPKDSLFSTCYDSQLHYYQCFGGGILNCQTFANEPGEWEKIREIVTAKTTITEIEELTHSDEELIRLHVKADFTPDWLEEDGISCKGEALKAPAYWERRDNPNKEGNCRSGGFSATKALDATISLPVTYHGGYIHYDNHCEGWPLNIQIRAFGMHDEASDWISICKSYPITIVVGNEQLSRGSHTTATSNTNPLRQKITWSLTSLTPDNPSEPLDVTIDESTGYIQVANDSGTGHVTIHAEYLYGGCNGTSVTDEKTIQIID